jgi:hypothetical protein
MCQKNGAASKFSSAVALLTEPLDSLKFPQMILHHGDFNGLLFLKRDIVKADVAEQYRFSQCPATRGRDPTLLQ